MKTLVIIPTYNERDNIVELIKTLLENTDIAVLVVDDNSPDGTGELVREYASKEPNVYCLHRGSPSGIGPAYRAGFQWALERGYLYIIQMDADFSHNPSYIKEFLAVRERYDLIIGSRYVSGGKIRNWKRFRKFTSWAGNFYTLYVLRLKNKNYQIHDSTSGFKLWRADILKKINASKIHSNSYAFQIAMHWYAAKYNARILEIPIVFEDRRKGVSKIGGLRVIIEALILPPLLR